MQRKNYFLKKSTQYRSGIAMIMAIMVVVIIGTIMALSLSMTAQTSKRTTDVYLYEQAVLVSKSAAELALLDIAKTGPCTIASDHIGAYRMDLNRNASTSDDIYNVVTTVRYVYDGFTCLDPNDNYADVTTDEQNGSVLMDITVSVDDPTITSEPIRYFRRSIQKL
ncbi:MAG: hypothetical protein ACI9TV_000295 [Sulfurimonas sp.]|jgi:hypothetical protein|uniref:hypothetical protein n=1 Tax=Sulfurimonas sp. TaxID=2022749 RepID=UPI0039E2C8D2